MVFEEAIPEHRSFFSAPGHPSTLSRARQQLVDEDCQVDAGLVGDGTQYGQCRGRRTHRRAGGTRERH